VTGSCGRRHQYPRDHFCSHTQANAAATQPKPMSGMSDTNVHTAALIRHKTMAKTPTRMFAMDWMPVSVDAFRECETRPNETS
jgi:hypothetical protein